MFTEIRFPYALFQWTFHWNLGLPTVPYFPGRPVFQGLCPASRAIPSRDTKCPVLSGTLENVRSFLQYWTPGNWNLLKIKWPSIEMYSTCDLLAVAYRLQLRPRLLLTFHWHRPRGTPPPGELKTRGVAKYSDFRPINCYISETVQDSKLVLITNRKSYMSLHELSIGTKIGDIEWPWTA